MIYGAIAGSRMARSGARAGVPVICVGNLTVGGAGKTPTALVLAAMLSAVGEAPCFLTRGYGGRLAGPVTVDPARHDAGDVGDEPLLLARAAPTVVARERVAGAAHAEALGASVIVMDDGFQNPSLEKDLSVIVIDGGRGIGNGHVLPAGPLRAPLAAQLGRAHAALVIGKPEASCQNLLAECTRRDLTVHRGHLVPDETVVAALAGRRLLAFAGIGDPDKFFRSLADAGLTVAARRGFPDHHRFTGEEARALCDQAEREALTLVTTEKDLARLRGDREAAALAERAIAFPVRLAFEDDAAIRAMVKGALSSSPR